MASRLRVLLIGGGLFLFVVAVPVGLLIYSAGWLGDQNLGSSQQQSEPITNETSVGRCADSSGTISDLRRELGGLVSRGEVSNGKIAFTRSTEDASDIYVVDEEGTRETKLTPTNEFEVDPIWSPDGQKIAYFTSPNGLLYVMNADGTNRISLAGDVMLQRGVPAWSPDGQKIAYVDTYGELKVIKADGTTEARLTRLMTSAYSEGQTQLGNPAWSPDGKRIAFARGAIPDTSSVSAEAHAPAEGLTGIYLINVDGTGQCKLTSIPEEPLFQAYQGSKGPVWSPDGGKIAYEVGSINVINADGSGRKALPAGTYDPPQFAWSPDGKRIAFIDASSELNVINADGSGRRGLTNAPGEPYGAFPTWSPDSEKLAFSCPFLEPRRKRTDLCVINADGTGLKRVATEVNAEAFPVTSSWGRE